MSRPAYHVSYSLFLHAFCNITTYAGVIGSPDMLILLRSAQCLLLTLQDTHGLTAFSDILADRHRSPPYNVPIQTMRNAYGSAATSHVCSLRIPAIATAPLECMLCPAFHATQAPSRSTPTAGDHGQSSRCSRVYGCSTGEKQRKRTLESRQQLVGFVSSARRLRSLRMKRESATEKRTSVNADILAQAIPLTESKLRPARMRRVLRSGQWHFCVHS